MLPKESWEEKKIGGKINTIAAFTIFKSRLFIEKKPLLFTGIRSLRLIRISSFDVSKMSSLFGHWNTLIPRIAMYERQIVSTSTLF